VKRIIKREEQEISIAHLLGLIFIPTTLLTTAYIVIGQLQAAIPSILLFFILASVILFPIELAIILLGSKKKYGRYSLKS